MEKNNNTNFCLFDINKLSQASLRKYAIYFRIQEEDIDKLKILICQHFKNDLKVDSETVISEMLNLKRLQTQRQLKKQRTSRTNNLNTTRTSSSQKNH